MTTTLLLSTSFLLTRTTRSCTSSSTTIFRAASIVSSLSTARTTAAAVATRSLCAATLYNNGRRDSNNSCDTAGVVPSTVRLTPGRHNAFLSSSSTVQFSTSPAAAAVAASPAEHQHDQDGDANSSSTFPFLLADIGEGIKEVELLQWYVRAGDEVRQFDKICEVQSDKATVEITSRYDGTVANLAGHAAGDMCQVGQPLLYFVGKDGMSASTTATAAGGSSTAAVSDAPNGSTGGGGMLQDATAGTTIPTTTLSSVGQDESSSSSVPRLQIPTVASHYHLPSDGGGGGTAASAAAAARTNGDHRGKGKFLASPAVRKLGMEYALDLSTLQGSGPSGRLLKCDVVTHLKEQGLWKEHDNIAPPIDSQLEPLSEQQQQQDQQQPQQQQRDHDRDQSVEIVPLKGYNRLMMDAMTSALQIPHMGFGDELVVNRLLECRKDLSAVHEKVSLVCFLVKACSLALREVPLLNARGDAAARHLMLYKNHDIGIAMDTPRGLVVPVIRNVQDKNLLQIQQDLDCLKELAKTAKLAAEDLQNPTFTLSNIGSTGQGTYMQPVIVPPQLAMGAIGKIQRVPRFREEEDDNGNRRSDPTAAAGEVYAAAVMQVTWAADHRFLDGATLARFNAAFKAYIEHPVHMLAHLK